MAASAPSCLVPFNAAATFALGAIAGALIRREIVARRRI